MKRVLLLGLTSFMLLTSGASVASADTWYHPNSGDYWYCDYYDGQYWCLMETGQWIRANPTGPWLSDGWIPVS